MIYDAFAHLPIYGLEDLGFVPRGEAGAFIAGHNTAPGRQIAAQHQWRRPVLHAFRHVRHVRLAGERALNARHRPRPDPLCPDLGLPRRRRHVRRFRHHHHVERGTVGGKRQAIVSAKALFARGQCKGFIKPPYFRLAELGHGGSK
jgi:hypothetical protein